MWQWVQITQSNMSQIAQWARNAASNVSLDATGLIALADLTVLARRTALTGSSCYADTLVLCPGIHKQQDAIFLNGGEYPITANMNSGYVFRIENQATVNYLQNQGKTGALTTLHVFEDKSRLRWLKPYVDLPGPVTSALLYILPLLLTITSIAFAIAIEDYWGLGILAFLMLARLLNVVVIRRRRDAKWHGFLEEGKHQELLVLLSQDRWIRITGLVDQATRRRLAR